MTNEEAKFILQAYRPSGADVGDTAFQPALEQCANDATLAKWMERQRAFDQAVAAKLRSVEPPAGLRDLILAGAKASRPPVPVWWRQPKWLMVAASVLLVFGFGFAGLLKNRADPANDFPVFAMDYVAGGFFLSQHNADVAELRNWLSRQNAPLPKDLPVGFAQLRSLGCKTLDYRGKDVSLICFGEGKEYHLFVVRREDFPMMPAKSTPQFLVRNGRTSAAWSDEKNHYVVVTDDSLKALKECLDCRDS